VAAVLSAAGLPADRYLFLGFVPRKGSERTRLLDRASTEEWTTVFFEAPGRLLALLQDLAGRTGGQREAVVAREVTKLHEEFQAGTLDELVRHFGSGTVRGEITVVLQGTGQPPAPPDRTEEAGILATELLAAGHSRKETVRMVVEAIGVPRNEVYRLVMDLP
jgi:16S rRNA (cytidine1402-2'-O)-methyltransferase